MHSKKKKNVIKNMCRIKNNHPIYIIVLVITFSVEVSTWGF